MTDLHVHTNFSDGNHTPRQMVEAALEKGMATLGFSDHSYTSFDLSCCIPLDKLPEYRSCIQALKAEYRDRIRILLGIEQDLYSDFPAEGYDYIIGSVHCIQAEGEYITVDFTPEILVDAVNTHFGGDIYGLIERYYDAVSQVVEKTGADIIGHFDLVTKFNEGGRLFDENHPRYVAAWQAAADQLLETGKPFEINTGAISRGYRREPYPAKPIRDYIRAKGGRFILSSDCHSRDNLCFGFEALEGEI